MDFMELAKARYSVRSFSDRPVEEEKLAQILEAAKYAPTAVNCQPQKIYVLKSSEAMEKIKRLTNYVYGAPMALLICSDSDRAAKRRFAPGVDYGETDCSIVCTYLVLAAWNLGIGSCWVGAFNYEGVIKEFNLPANIRPLHLLPLGYPSETAHPYKKMHGVYRPQEEIVTVL